MVDGWQKRKTMRVENEAWLEAAAVEAKIRMLETSQAGDIAWENTSINNAGWKDEWFTVLLSIPAALCFLPGGEVYVVNGFHALDSCPEWYRWSFLVAVGSSFGYRRIADFMSLKKGV